MERSTRKGEPGLSIACSNSTEAPTPFDPTTQPMSDQTPVPSSVYLQCLVNECTPEALDELDADLAHAQRLWDSYATHHGGEGAHPPSIRIANALRLHIQAYLRETQ